MNIKQTEYNGSVTVTGENSHGGAHMTVSGCENLKRNLNLSGARKRPKQQKMSESGSHGRPQKRRQCGPRTQTGFTDAALHRKGEPKKTGICRKMKGTVT